MMVTKAKNKEENKGRVKVIQLTKEAVRDLTRRETKQIKGGLDDKGNRDDKGNDRDDKGN